MHTANLRRMIGWGVLAAALCVALPAQAQVKVDPKLPKYTPVAGISGKLKSVGSDTMNNLMALWSEGFKKHYPGVTFEVEGKGSGSAPPALTAGTCDLGPMSRPMKDEEINAFEEKYGYKPVALSTCIDMLAIFVHKDNPLESLTLAEADAIFSKTRKRGHPNDILTWKDAGAKDKTLAPKKISLYGRNSASGTYGYFKEHVLAKGDFKDSVKEQPGSSTVVQGVAKDKTAIGYSGIGYLTPGVKALALAEESGEDPVPADASEAYTGNYPLSRPLLVYLNLKPDSELPPVQREFIRYVLSQEGQAEVVNDGYFPVTAKMAEEALGKIGDGKPETPKKAAKKKD